MTCGAHSQSTYGRLYGQAERNDIRRRRGRRQEAYDLKYKFTVAGVEYTGEEDKYRAEKIPHGADVSISFDRQNVSVPVYYDPSDPTDNSIERPDPLFPKIIADVALLCSPVGLLLMWRVSRYDRYARLVAG